MFLSRAGFLQISLFAVLLVSCGKNEGPSQSVSNSSGEGAANSKIAAPSSLPAANSAKTDDLVRRISSEDISRGYSSDYANAVLALIERDPQLALRTLYNAGTISTQVGFDALCKKLMASNPDLVIHWLRNDLPNLTSNEHVAGVYWAAALRALITVDSGKALQLLESSTLTGTERKNAVQGMAYVFSGDNPDAARDWVSKLPPELRDNGFAGIGHMLAARDPAKAYQIAALVGSSQERARLSEHIFSEWLKSKPEEALREIEHLEPQQFEKIGLLGADNDNSFLKGLAQKKPELLCNLLLQVTPGSGNKVLFESSVRALVGSNFDYAFRAVSDLPPGELRNELMELSFAIGAKPDDVAKYVQMAAGLEGPVKASAIQGLGRSVAKNSIDDIIGTSTGIEEASRSKFLLSALTYSTTDRLADLTEKITTQAFQGKLTDDDSKALTQNVAGRLAISDSSRAMSWYEQLPQDQRGSAMRGIAGELAREDVNRLGDWLNSMERNEEWVAGASILVRHLNYSDSQSAAEWKEALASVKKARQPE